MTPAEFKEGVGAYVMGALDPDEKEAFDEFLASGQADEDCMRALRRAERAAEAMSQSLPPVKPSPEVWQSIEAEITMAPPAASEPSGTVIPVVRSAIPWALAASMLVLTVLTQRQVSLLKDQVSSLQTAQLEARSQLHEARSGQKYVVHMMHLEGTQTVRVGHDQNDHRVVFLMHAGVKECGVIASGMEPPEGKVYQLWFTGEGKPVSAGVIPKNEDGTVVMPVDWKLMASHPTGIAVSIEPEGGSPTPTQVVMQGPL